jgi:hypothetical protein
LTCQQKARQQKARQQKGSRMLKTEKCACGAGCLDGKTGLEMVEEVFTHEKGDYYALSDGVAHSNAWSEAWKVD